MKKRSPDDLLPRQKVGDATVVKHVTHSSVRTTSLLLGVLSLCAVSAAGAYGMSTGVFDTETPVISTIFPGDKDKGTSSDVDSYDNGSSKDASDVPIEQMPKDVPTDDVSGDEQKSGETQETVPTDPSHIPPAPASAGVRAPGAPVDVPAPGTSHQSRDIVWGDTLSEIAEEYDTGVNDLSNKNNIYDPNVIFAGDTIYIVSPNTNAAGQPVGDGQYTYENVSRYYVERGDTWSTISVKTGIPETTLYALNSKYSSYPLHEGMTVVVRN